jgi:DNA-binding CsgD family transcriptional regulator/PAS domain-containing protein
MQSKGIVVAQKAKSPDVPLETFSKVVEAVYDCALDPSRWRDTINMISDLLESQRCSLGVHDYTTGRNELAVQTPYENDHHWWRLHEETYSRLSPLWAPAQLLSVGSVATLTMMIDDDEFVESRYYQEWVKPQGIHDIIAVKVLQTGKRAGLLTANRAQNLARYGDKEIQLLTLLSPHVCRAIAISDALNLKAVRSEALEATLNALATGVYLVDRQGRIVFMNSAAEKQVRDNNAVRIQESRLLPADHKARVALTKIIDESVTDEAATPTSGVMLALPDKDDGGLVATVLPLNRGDRRNFYSPFAAMAAIFVQDPIVVPPLPGEAFAKLYGLTGSELRVLLAMAPGLSVKEAAEVLGISETTAKTHLQHIYEKTHTSKQTELMHLFMSSTPPVRAAQDAKGQSA